MIHIDQCGNCGGFERDSTKEWKKEHPRSQRHVCLAKMHCRYYNGAFQCDKCGFKHDDRNHVHSKEECVISHVLNS